MPSAFCQCGGLDIFIANDQSGSVDARENLKSREFITKLAQGLPLVYSPGGFRIAIADWDYNRNWQQFTFPQAGKQFTTNISDIIAYANSPRIFYEGTDLILSLSRSFQAIQNDADQHRPKVILLLTDAQPGNTTQPGLVELAAQIKNSGVFIAVMAIESAKYYTELIEVASTGGYFFADSYDELAGDAATYAQSIAYAACKGNEPTFDLAIELKAFNALGCYPGPGTYSLEYAIKNTGRKAWNDDIVISFYDNDPAQYGSKPIAVINTGKVFIDAGGVYQNVFSSDVLSGYQLVNAVVNFDGKVSGVEMPVYPSQVMPLLVVAGERSSDNNFSNLISRVNGNGCIPRAAIYVAVEPDGVGCGNTTAYTVRICNTGNLDTRINSYAPVPDAGFALVHAETNIDSARTSFYNTYFGGSRDDYAYGAAADAFGFIYITGQTNSTNNIATPGAYRTNNGNTQDAFLAKFNAKGNRIWATYFGGVGSENGYSVATDKEGNVYVTGETSNSLGIATGGAAQVSSGGGYDAWLAKFDANGVLQWATYYGGAGADYGRSIAIDSRGNVYLAGITASANNIATAGAHQPALGGGNDAFLVKFNKNGVRQWGTYYGGIATESGFGIAIDANDYVYLTGLTGSANNIATAASFQSVKSVGNDAYLVKFDSDGIRQWGTYFGGNNSDNATGITVDKNNGVYITGNTTSTNFATALSHQAVNNGSTDAFLTKFDSDGKLKWCTYYGGAGTENGRQVSADRNGFVYLSGNTTSATEIATANSLQPAYGGNTDAYLVKFDSDGVRQWGTYFGGTQMDIASASVTDPLGKVYATGATQSLQISTPNAFQLQYGGGGNDAFLLKIDEQADFVIKAGACVTMRYFYDVTTAAAGNHDYSFTVTTDGLQPADPVAVITPDNTGFNGTQHTSDNVAVLNQTAACTPGDKVHVQLDIPPVQSCGIASYATATITINNTSGLLIHDAVLELNLSGTGAFFPSELYGRSKGLVLAQPNMADRAYPAVQNALLDKSGAISIPVYQLPAGTSQAKVDLSVGSGSVSFAARVAALTPFFNESGVSNVALNNSAVTPTPLPGINGWNYPATVNEGDTVHITGINTANAQSLQWVSATAGNLLNDGTTSEPALSYRPTETDIANGYAMLSLTVLTNAGCDASAQAYISIKHVPSVNIECGPFVPNAFTPNNDGRNDGFRLTWNCGVSQYKLWIYNRWGQKVFESTDATMVWDGRVNGYEQPMDSFIWYCQYQLNGINQTKKGIVTLIR
ncbi:SBBP repeat-containing protein [Niastella sp. OAS944]|uniref:SBBP repeat-containing protein n=1 Tax=Niastella sp. OAS944 TaxID=2664089 RepID=UPI0035C7A9BC|nr:gliding motility-associated-like protein [Chitinophagaceae bacterium OAS944]